MMVKFLLGISIIAFTCFCGYLLAKKYRQRKTFFTQFNEFNERYLNEIAYYRRPLACFFSLFSYKSEFAYILKDFLNRLKENGNVMEDILQSQEYSFLKKEDKSFIIDYFYMLGRGDSVSQKGYFSSVNEAIKKLQINAETECKKYGDLYIKLGFLLGLLILILIV